MFQLLPRWLFLSAAILVALPGITSAQNAVQDINQDTAPTLLHLLDYISVDYAGAVENGQIKNADEYAEMREFVAQTRTLLLALPVRAEQASLLTDVDLLARRIEEKAAAQEIASKATALRQAVIRVYEVAVAPQHAPDIARGAALYELHCAACHGINGSGDGPAGKALNPAPANFNNVTRMQQRSAYGLYSTITLGVTGTSMASFKQLPDDERWALAFFVANHVNEHALQEKGAALWTTYKTTGRTSSNALAIASLAVVATLSTNEAKERFGDEGFALFYFLRTNPLLLDTLKPAPLQFAIDTLGASLDVYRQGAHADATRLAIQAYLEGFELVESSLRNVDADLMVRTERAMMAYRSSLQENASLAEVERQAEVAQALLKLAREKLDSVQLSPTTAFVSALVILLREGAEAILVVAAMLAFLARSGRTEARRYIHAGWIAALALGGVTWMVSNYLIGISGANREMTEGVTALLAAAMLLYVGYWLHSKSHSAAWQKFIGDKVSGALSTGTMWTLALISFLAVYREAFETVLFYQALSTQAGPDSRSALFGGIALAVLLLIALAWMILRAAVKLPIALFFSVSSIVLLILAVAFTGQGIAALQEAGKINVDAVNFISIPMLGIHPTLQTLAGQAAAMLLSAAGLWWAARGKAQKTPR